MLTWPLQLSINPSVIPGVNHNLSWPAITACSQSEHRPPCWSPAWTPHPSRNAFGFPPKFLQPPSFYLSLPIHNTHIYGLNRSITQSTVLSPPFSIPPSLFRPLSNYVWYLAWVTVFNNVLKNKRALLKEWRGSEAAKRPNFGAARWRSVFSRWMLFASTVGPCWW